MTALLLLRGPLLMAAVIATVTLPLLLQLSKETVLILSLLILGLVLTINDAIALAEITARQQTSTFLNSIVLDNVLRSIFDPESGWIACWVSVFVGNVSMYSMRMTVEQRIRLVQSCLGCSAEQARNILISPGGFQAMLPQALQDWLRSGKNHVLIQEPPHAKEIETDTHACDVSNETGETDSFEEASKYAYAFEAEGILRDRNVATLGGGPSGGHRNRGVASGMSSQQTTPVPTTVGETYPAYPFEVMASIVREMASDAIKRSCLNVPDGAFQALAITSSAAFAMHLSHSPRARRIIGGAIEGTVSLTFACVAAGAVAALLTKAQVTGSSPIQRSQLMPFARGLLTKLRQACFNGGNQRLQGIIAILLYVGRRRTRMLHESRNG